MHNKHAHIPRNPRTVPVQDGAALRRARLFCVVPAAIALLLGAVEWWATPSFIALHCALLAAICVLAGRACTSRALAQGLAQDATSMGTLGGLMAGLAYAAPFIAGTFLQWIRFDNAALTARIAALSTAEIARARSAGFDPLSAAFHTNQAVSYMFGYLLFGLGLGWVLGRFGAAMAMRRA